MAHDVFISHSSLDRQAADALCTALEASGVPCWMAPRDIPPGADWQGEIIEAISATKLMLVLFSKNGNASANVSKEVTAAADTRTPIIPVRLDDTAPSPALRYHLSGVHWLDAFPPPLTQHLDRLTDVFKGRLTRMAGAAAPVAAPPTPPATATPPPVAPTAAPPIAPATVTPAASPSSSPVTTAASAPTAGASTAGAAAASAPATPTPATAKATPTAPPEPQAPAAAARTPVGPDPQAQPQGLAGLSPQSSGAAAATMNPTFAPPAGGQTKGLSPLVMIGLVLGGIMLVLIASMFFIGSQGQRQVAPPVQPANVATPPQPPGDSGDVPSDQEDTGQPPADSNAAGPAGDQTPPGSPLAQQEQELSTLYNQVHARASDTDTLEQSEQAFQESRQACNGDQQCLTNLYADRRNILQNWGN